MNNVHPVFASVLDAICPPAEQRIGQPSVHPRRYVERRENWDRRADFDDVVLGRPCDFWPINGWQVATDSPRYDAEQQLPLFGAVQRAAALIGASDADRWRCVQRELARLAYDYAAFKAEEREL